MIGYTAVIYTTKDFLIDLQIVMNFYGELKYDNNIKRRKIMEGNLTIFETINILIKLSDLHKS